MASFPKQKPGTRADVALLLEGTYPYVPGGVSSWVHQIIRGFPDLTFSAVFLGGSREMYEDEPRYELPDNVIHVQEHYLMDSWTKALPKSMRGNEKAHAEMSKLHDFFREPHRGLPDDLLERTASVLGTPEGIPREDFLYSEETWDRVCQDYDRFCTDPSFVDYFWTVRTMHSPLFTLAEISRTLPPCNCLHSISTGYAGFLGVLLSRSRNLPFILSEHGIYTKERRIDLANADWIKDVQEAFGGGMDERVSYIRRLWIRFFEGLGRLTYAASNPIVALFEGNRLRQVDDGAEDERTINIPNGIDIERFSALREKRSNDIPQILGLVGRVVPIKDIRTFIRAMRSVCSKLPDAEGWIIGPEEEDPDYVKECKELTASLGLQEKVKFLGFQKVDELLPKIGLMTLTSISEGLPLVVLEAYAAGLPCLATDVGSCRELIEGQSAEDRAIGASGRVVSIADPEATAAAAVELLGDPDAWYSAQKAAIARVERYYTQPQMFDRYRKIYQTALEDSAGRHRLRAS